MTYEVPCALNSKVYIIERRKIKECEVTYIGLCGNGSIQLHILYYKNKDDFKTMCYTNNNIDKFLFLTKEKAEERLEYMKSIDWNI